MLPRSVIRRKLFYGLLPLHAGTNLKSTCYLPVELREGQSNSAKALEFLQTIRQIRWRRRNRGCHGGGARPSLCCCFCSLVRARSNSDCVAAFFPADTTKGVIFTSGSFQAFKFSNITETELLLKHELLDDLRTQDSYCFL